MLLELFMLGAFSQRMRASSPGPGDPFDIHGLASMPCSLPDPMSTLLAASSGSSIVTE